MRETYRLDLYKADANGRSAGSSASRMTGDLTTSARQAHSCMQELGQSVWQEPRGPNDRIVGDMGPPPPQALIVMAVCTRAHAGT
eukprot:4544816-Amphidinium_carterae.2